MRTERRPRNLSGKKFGMLSIPRGQQAIEVDGPTWAWVGDCGCGRTGLFQASALLKGLVKDCGCSRKSKMWRQSNPCDEDHPHEWLEWRKMVRRVLDVTHPEYVYYGGRGIPANPRWLSSFRAFLSEVGAMATPDCKLFLLKHESGFYKKSVVWLRVIPRGNRGTLGVA